MPASALCLTVGNDDRSVLSACNSHFFGCFVGGFQGFVYPDFIGIRLTFIGQKRLYPRNGNYVIFVGKAVSFVRDGNNVVAVFLKLLDGFPHGIS